MGLVLDQIQSTTEEEQGGVYPRAGHRVLHRSVPRASASSAPEEQQETGPRPEVTAAPRGAPLLKTLVCGEDREDEEPELAEEELVLGCWWCICCYSFWHVAPAENDEEFGAD